MNASNLWEQCNAISDAGGLYINLLKLKGAGRFPKGFPRGELICETERGNLYQYPVVKVMAWMVKNGLAKIEDQKPLAPSSGE